MSDFEAPRGGSHRKRFWFGFALPFRLLGATRRDADARRAYRRCMWAQALVTIVIGVAMASGAFYGVLRLAELDDMDVRFDAEGLHMHQRLTVGDDAPAPEPESKPELQANKQMFSGMAWLPEHVRIVGAFMYLLYACLCISEWLVIALSRDYHDQIGRRASLLSGAPPEDPEEKPRVRLNLRWLWSKAKRRARGLRVIVMGAPVLMVADVIPSAWGIASAVIGTLWTGYWLSVFVGAKSALAWHDEKTAGDPWFLRAWTDLEKKSRLWRWWLPRAYGRLWRRGSRAVFAPCARFEESPWELAGLGLVRVLGGLPVFYLFVRPFIPVAAAHIILPHAPPDAPE